MNLPRRPRHRLAVGHAEPVGHGSGRRVPGRRLLASVALGVSAAFACAVPLEIALSPPASAQAYEALLGGGTPKPTVTLDPGSPGTTLTSSTPKFSGSAVPGDQGGLTGKITAVKVVISSSDGHPGATFSITPQPPANGSDAWTFSGGPSAPLAYNGAYQATVTVTETDTELLGNTTTGTGAASASFAEDVAPVAPQGVSTTVSDPGSAQPGVLVSWSANPEPDILGYDVLRSQGGGAPESVGTTTSTSYDDSTAKAGVNYSYEVVALRAGDASGQSLLSPASSASTVSVPVATSPPTSPPPAAKVTTPTTSGSSASAKALAKAASSDIASSGIPTASGSSTPSTSGSSNSSTSGSTGTKSASTTATTGAAGNSGAAEGKFSGNYSPTLPYPKVTSAAPATDPPPKSGSRARKLAEVALGMIFLVVAALVIRLVLRTSRRA